MWVPSLPQITQNSLATPFIRFSRFNLWSFCTGPKLLPETSLSLVTSYCNLLLYEDVYPGQQRRVTMKLWPQVVPMLLRFPFPTADLSGQKLVKAVQSTARSAATIKEHGHTEVQSKAIPRSSHVKKHKHWTQCLNTCPEEAYEALTVAGRNILSPSSCTSLIQYHSFCTNLNAHFMLSLHKPLSPTHTFSTLTQ